MEARGCLDTQTDRWLQRLPAYQEQKLRNWVLAGTLIW